MNGAAANPGFHGGAETGRTTGWRSQQYFAASPYETTNIAALTWDVGKQQVRFITLNVNSTLAFPTNAKLGATYILVLKQDGTGSRTLSYTNQLAGFGAGTWKWTAATAPTLTTTAAKIDVLTFLFDGTDMLGTAVQNM